MVGEGGANEMKNEKERTERERKKQRIPRKRKKETSSIYPRKSAQFFWMKGLIHNWLSGPHCLLSLGESGSFSAISIFPGNCGQI